MPLKRAFLSGFLGALCAAGTLSCDGSDGGAAANLVGTWVRTKIFQPGDASDPETDTWTLTLREDETFTLVHRHEEVTAYTPIVQTTARDGEWSAGSDGMISFSGGWAENLDEVNTLDELAAVYMNFTQVSMYTLGGSGDVLFLGPDFNHDSVYVFGDSYDLLFSDGGSSYLREANLVLTDGSGAVIEQRVESYNYTLIDDVKCSVTYSYNNVYASGPQSGSGTATDCEYFYEEGKTVDGLDGAATTVSVIRFEYTMDDVGKDDNFAILGDALISYQPSYQTKVLINNAYVKTPN
jgi:hypothetical protein